MTWSAPLAARFLGAPADDAQLARLEALWLRARARLEGDPAEFVDRLRVLSRGDLDLAERLRVDEVWLAHRCMVNDPHAQALLEREYLSKVPLVLKGLGDAAFQDDVLQELRLALFLEDSRLAQYEGRGSLLGWLRSVCHRLALTRLRLSSAHAPVAPGADDVIDSRSAEQQLLRQGDRAAFTAALLDGLGALPDQERAVLRLNLVEGLNIDLIGELFGVHRATAARWLARAKEQLARSVREGMTTRLSLSEPELSALMTSLEANLDVSVRRYLDES